MKRKWNIVVGCILIAAAVALLAFGFFSYIPAGRGLWHKWFHQSPIQLHDLVIDRDMEK